MKCQKAKNQYFLLKCNQYTIFVRRKTNFSRSILSYLEILNEIEKAVGTGPMASLLKYHKCAEEPVPAAPTN
jgi:hypothetical protein